ncbi:MAG: GAF domain-containing protein, partial [Chroococcidiopsidaceae cyanobacterium CP_BM_RX_35]|nr:GAF domain-containing protein [Chroococcidiopsidaceae cyanobacterium CP_BM_RX_35]
MKDPLQNNEAARLETLYQYEILDTKAEESFDELTRLAALICETPIALVSLIDARRQWFKSKVGMEATETLRALAFCTQTIQQPDVLIVPDALADCRFATNPLVTSAPQIRFYAGVSLITPNGHALGTLCVIDRVPRELSPLQVEALRTLGHQVMTQLELQRHVAALARTATESKQTAEALRQQTEREQLVVDIAQRIRQSLKLEEILSTTVSEVRQFLQVERVFIYRFEPDWGGIVVVESVDADRKPILGSRLKDPTFADTYVQPYKQGRIQATADIYAGELTQCYVDFLAEFQVRATLVVPILQEDELWGLLVANHCSSSRQWQQLESDLLKSLATQVGIAIQQSTLFEQIQTELVERLQAEQKISEQAALLNVATDAIFVQALENQILFWNQGAEHLYGWQAKEALGKKANELLYKEALPQLEDAQKTVALRGEWSGELQQVTKLGQEVIVSSRWTLVRDKAGQPKSILVVNTDITEKKQLEAQFLRAQRLESIGTLASGITHDLNNVLGPVLMIAELLEEKIPDARSQQLLAELQNSAKRGAALVKQVLSFARGAEGQLQALELGPLVSELVRLLRQTFPRSIEIHLTVPRDLWLVRADATQVHQVLMNLC